MGAADGKVGADMLLDLSLPEFGPEASCTLLAWHGAAGDHLTAGAPLVDLRVDLSGGVQQDCPPVSVCRIVLREPAWLRQTLADPGSLLAAGQALAMLSSDAQAPPGGETRAAARVTVAAILHHDDWWAGDP